MASGAELAFVARPKSLRRVPPRDPILPLHPSVAVPPTRRLAARPEDLLSPDDVGRIEKAAAVLTETWWTAIRPSGIFSWRGVNLAECLSAQLDLVALDLAKTVWIVKRAFEAAKPGTVLTDVPPLAGEFPPYPYLAALHPVLDAFASANGVTLRVVSGDGREAPAPVAAVPRLYSAVAARRGLEALGSGKTLAAFGPFPDIYRPLARAWMRVGSATVVFGPARAAVRNVRSMRLHFLPLETLAKSNDRQEMREFTDRIGEKLRTAQFPGAIVEGVDLSPALREHLVKSLPRSWSDAALVGLGFERGLERASHLVLTETVSQAARAAVRYARRAKVPITVLQHGVIAGARSYRRTEGDRVAAWGPKDAAWFRGALPAGVEVAATGSPRYDGMAGIRGGAGAGRTGKLEVLFASQPFVQFHPRQSPWDRQGILDAVLGAARRCSDVELLVKWHPAEAGKRLDATPDLKARVREVRKGSALAMAASADVVLTLSSTVALEAMFLGRPVVFLGEADPAVPFSPPEEGGGLRARNAEELADQLRALAENPAFRAEVLGRQAAYLTKSFTPADGKAAERVVEFLEGR